MPEQMLGKFSQMLAKSAKKLRVVDLNASAVMVNDHTAFRVDWMPFGGQVYSGLGMGGIANSAREMSREKLIVFKSDRLM